MLIKKLGGSVAISVEEIDDTGGNILTMNIINRSFHFSVEKKQ